MSSGCAILAIGPESQAGIAYLKANDAAICVNDMKELGLAVRNLVDNTELLKEYSKKANQLGKKNHNRIEIDKMIKTDFYNVVKENRG